MTKAYEKDSDGQYHGTRIEEIRVVKKVKRVEGT
jgi:molybdenum cofactor biosynthesis enzyme